MSEICGCSHARSVHTEEGCQEWWRYPEVLNPRRCGCVGFWEPRDGTRLGRDLARLEAQDPEVRDAAKRLDEVMDPWWWERQEIRRRIWDDPLDRR